MEIEIVEFYPFEIKAQYISGTVKVRIPELKMSIQGVVAIKKKDNWFFSLPGREGFDPVKKKTCKYTYVLFDDPSVQKEFLVTLRSQGAKFVEDRIKDTSRPLVFLPQTVKKTRKPSYVNRTLNHTIRDIKNPLESSKSILATKWIDPPKKSNFRK